MKDKKSSQIDKYRIDKLNEVNFQWSLQKSTKTTWNVRFEVRSLSPLGPRPLSQFYSAYFGASSFPNRL